MARYAAEMKGGFYPTPPEEIEHICKRIKIKPGIQANILDPCAGEGVALNLIGQSLKKQGGNVVTYGIEIEETKAAKCKKILDHAILSAYEDALVSPEAFSFIWLNPPYEEYGSSRAEEVFLRELTNRGCGKLQSGGLLDFCIPCYVLKHTATLLALRFEEIKVYRFTAKNFARFKQIVVFGYRRKKANTKASDLAEKLKILSGNPERIPPLDTPDGIIFEIPESAEKVKNFRGAHLEKEEVLHGIAASPVWEEVAMLMPRRCTINMKQPVLPLNSGHIAVAIASGALKEDMGNHLLVGKTTRVKIVSVTEKEDNIVEKETNTYRTAVMVFSPEGVFELK